ncbi:MAG TPA: hypothetical protein VF647_09910 [Longimicrobium sp.]|jgi:hypothetical protein
MNALRSLRAPFLALLCAAACGGPPPSPQAPPPLGLVPAASLLYDDDAGGLRDSLRLVVRAPAGLDSLWRRATAGQPAPPPPPAVDFGREMVLAVAAGRMTPNDRIRVDSVGVRRLPGADGRMREVLAVLVRTVEACERYTAAAYPSQVVRLRRFDGPVVFVERRERAEGCARE